MDPDLILPEGTRHRRRPSQYIPPSHGASAARPSPPDSRPRGRHEPAPSDPQDDQYYDDDPDSPWGRATLHKTEIEIIFDLAQKVNLLPVIAKADTLSAERLNAVKDAVRKDLQDIGLALGLGETRQVRSPGGSSVTTRTPSPYSVMPYAVMSADIFMHGDGVARRRPSETELYQQFQRATIDSPDVANDLFLSVDVPLQRSYRWGTIDVLNPQHTDFLALREMALNNHLMVRIELYFTRFITDIAFACLLGSSIAHPSSPVSQVQRGLSDAFTTAANTSPHRARLSIPTPS